MKVAAYTALHYGKDYLPYAIRSVIDQVNRYIILYTPNPSYGHRPRGIQCPEHKDELRAICEKEAGAKLVWVDVERTFREGDHRNIAFKYADDCDVLAVVDADEVWNPETFNDGVEFASKSANYQIGVNHQGWYHFWRSFNEYLQDGFCPVRFHNLKASFSHVTDIGCPGTIYHFGYAQPVQLMEYKWQIHGHQDELREGWLDMWKNYNKGEHKFLHPSSEQIWGETQDFNKELLPEFMKEHPFYNLDRIV